MPQLNPATQPITPEEIYTELDLMHYQHQRLGGNFQGVPGIAIPAFTFSLLDSLWSRTARIDPRALLDIVVVPVDSGLFITIHIENSHAGDRAWAIMAAHVSNPLEQEFVDKFQTTILGQHRNHRRWIANGGRIFRLIPQDNSSPAIKRN
jgi:hypothetical protein